MKILNLKKCQYFDNDATFFKYFSSAIVESYHLSSLLFVLFVNPLPKFLYYTKMLLFADDIKLFIKITSPFDCLFFQSNLHLSVIRQNN